MHHRASSCLVSVPFCSICFSTNAKRKFLSMISFPQGTRCTIQQKNSNNTTWHLASLRICEKIAFFLLFLSHNNILAVRESSVHVFHKQCRSNSFHPPTSFIFFFFSLATRENCVKVNIHFWCFSRACKYLYRVSNDDIWAQITLSQCEPHRKERARERWSCGTISASRQCASAA